MRERFQTVELCLLYLVGLSPVVWTTFFPVAHSSSILENYITLVLTVMGSFAGYEMRRKFDGFHRIVGFAIFVFFLSVSTLLGVGAVLKRAL